MDVKGVMMAGSYSTQLRAKNYSDAVKEILEKTAYEKLGMQGMQVIKEIKIDNTPDKQRALLNPTQGTSDKTIEMVAESDYEFVVKAAKKHNFEFFYLFLMILQGILKKSIVLFIFVTKLLDIFFDFIVKSKFRMNL